MLEIRNRILQIRRERGLSWEEWAVKSHKTADTLKKQTAETANPTVETLLEMLRPLGASIVVMTDEERAAFEELPATQQHCADLEQQVSIYESDRKSKEAEISKLAAIIEKQEAIVEQLQKRVIAKDDAISRKDDVISQLLVDKGVIKKW